MRAGDDKLDTRIPRLSPTFDTTRLSLTPSEGYLLSRVDGQTPWSVLREVGGLAPKEVDRCLERWVGDGVIVLEGRATRPRVRQGAPARPIDPDLDMPVEMQQRVLEFEARLDRPYHEILGVSEDASEKEIKRAYFALSKEFHPDRYFRREIGPHAARLERIFKKMVEAYELLSDPTARSEVKRSLAEAGGPDPTRATRRRPQGPPGRDRPARPFSRHAATLAERRRKAAEFFEVAMAALAAGRPVEAAASVRLAIAFDPWNQTYKQPFAELQSEAHLERAADLTRRAESASQLGDTGETLRLIEEALNYAPQDPKLLHRAAELLYAARELERAEECAARLCELRPKVAAYHRTLGLILKDRGHGDEARHAFERALQLEPSDSETRAELRSLGRGRLAPLFSGGRR